MNRAYYRNTHAFIITYRITDRSTFEDIPKWIDKIDHNTDGDQYKILVGTMTDLESQR